MIPARWGSSRFPGKVVASLAGRPLVLHACDLAARTSSANRIVVATDDPRVAAVVEGAGFEAMATDPRHPTGTDRVAEVVSRTEATIAIGLQADEPFLEPADLDRLFATLAADPSCRLATLSAPLLELSEYLDPNVVKLVDDDAGRALCFSRAPLPYARPADGSCLPFPPDRLPPASLARKHVGIYGWQREALLAFPALPVSSWERTESLEQLRALSAGWTIRVLPATGLPFGVDTPEDLARAEQLWALRNSVQ